MEMAEDILKKLLAGDVTVWVKGQPGVGLDWSWIDLSMEEAQYLVDLGGNEKDPLSAE